MREEIRDRWVEALRSGDYCQTRQTLRDCDGFCCLGVLCDIYIQETSEPDSARARQWEGEHVFRIPDGDKGPDWYEELTLPDPVREWAGLAGGCGEFGEGRCLSDMNDSGYSFDEIADTIEQKWKEL